MRVYFSDEIPNTYRGIHRTRGQEAIIKRREINISDQIGMSMEQWIIFRFPASVIKWNDVKIASYKINQFIISPNTYKNKKIATTCYISIECHKRCRGLYDLPIDLV